MFKVRVIEPIENYVILVEYGVTYELAIENALIAVEKEGWLINELEYEVDELIF